MSVTAIVLATDRGVGFSGPKYLTPFRGSPMIEGVVGGAHTWSVDRVIVVLGADAEAVIDAGVLDDVDVIVDPEWEEGLASPMRAALDLAESESSTTHVVVTRGDQPGIDGDTVAALIERASSSGARAVIPKYRYARGWPVVLSRSGWEALLAREGSLDLLDHLAAHPETVEEVWIDRLSPTTYERRDDLPDSH